MSGVSGQVGSDLLPQSVLPMGRFVVDEVRQHSPEKFYKHTTIPLGAPKVYPFTTEDWAKVQRLPDGGIDLYTLPTTAFESEGKKYAVGINPFAFPDGKDDKSSKDVNDFWATKYIINFWLTRAEHKDAIARGHLSCSWVSYPWRIETAFAATGAVFLDVDGGWTIAEALADPFVQSCCGLIYTSSSHGKDGRDRFRLVFYLDNPITDLTRVRQLYRALHNKYAGKIDPTPKNPIGLFYGNHKNVTFPLYQEHAELAA